MAGKTFTFCQCIKTGGVHSVAKPLSQHTRIRTSCRLKAFEKLLLTKTTATAKKNMSLVPTTYRDLARELDRPLYYPPYDFHLYPYLWDDSRLLGPLDSYTKPMDELVTRRVRNQLIQSHLLNWTYPLNWDNYYNGERVRIDEKGFQVDIDVRQFRPHEILVKTNDDYVVVEGKHARRNDGNGLVERHFLRKYLLPRGFNANEVISDLSSDGILTIKAPPPPPAKVYKPSERLVNVYETGKKSLPWK